MTRSRRLDPVNLLRLRLETAPLSIFSFVVAQVCESQPQVGLMANLENDV